MPEHYSKFCKFHHPTLATICDLTSKSKPPLSGQVEPPLSRISPPKPQTSTESASITMSRDQSACCFPFTDWLDYTFTVLSMRIGGYKELEDESPQHRTLNIRFHDDDREWVERHLQPVVQERLSFFHAVTYGDKHCTGTPSSSIISKTISKKASRPCSSSVNHPLPTSTSYPWCGNRFITLTE
ncbi:uncharacterized protein LOC585009 [Strongylocentrotus purpuratus]|uniref:Uncharacterized protein n=1 Tax=Strongylocentrotus purpuratus TaxID=7668 RepID=A0A7M7GP79_STRPU|nr:uncharacterized protein LOC585009 [Strongylocentrotus purpuratus]